MGDDESQERGHWIQQAVKHKGALHKEMGVPQVIKFQPVSWRRQLSLAVSSASVPDWLRL